MRVVFDTNVFVSAFVVPGSHGERAFLLAQANRFELHTSVAILTETARVLRRKFDQDEDDIKQALRQISHTAVVSKPTSKLSVVDDAADNRILECALDTRADLVVTGDRHLLKLRHFEGIPIVRLADFLRRFPAGS
jgi:putative PIN family toxin of toxin-antitoxin system